MILSRRAKRLSDVKYPSASCSVKALEGTLTKLGFDVIKQSDSQYGYVLLLNGDGILADEVKLF